MLPLAALGPAGHTGHRVRRRHGPQQGDRRQARPVGRHQHDVGDRRRRAGDVHAGRVRLLGDRILAGPRTRARWSRRSSPTSPSPRSAGGRSASRSPSAARWAASSGTTAGSSSRTSARTARPPDGVTHVPPQLPGDGALRRDDRVEVVLPVRLLRRLAGDRLGHDPGADQVRRLHHLLGRLRDDHLPDRRALGVRRRLPADRRLARHLDRRDAGLRRLHGRPPDRSHRRVRRPAAARAAEGQVRRRTASLARSRATACRCSGSAC